MKFVMSQDEKDKSFPNWQTELEAVDDIRVPRRGDKVHLTFNGKVYEYEVSDVIWSYADGDQLPSLTIVLER